MPLASEDLARRYRITPDQVKHVQAQLKQFGKRAKPEDALLMLLMQKRHYRLTNLYHVLNEDGVKVQFVLSNIQSHFISNLWFRNLILKSRQVWITTVICMLLLDECVFGENKSAGIIAQTEGYARAFFDKKVKFAYDNLPDEILSDPRAKLISDRNDLMKFGNGSSLYVDCSLRSDTVQYLHISEFGDICAKRPDKAKEIVSGALNAIHPGNYVFIESTGEGSAGYFYDYSQAAMNAAIEKKPLGLLDFKFFFYGWYCKPGNSLPSDSVVITKEDQEYFDMIEPEIKKLAEAGVIMPIPNNRITSEQKAWYVSKKIEQKDNMKSQHPSTPDEAFLSTAEGAYFRKEMAHVRTENQIMKVPYERGYPVNTSWDFGKRGTAIWFHQCIRGEDRLINFYQNVTQGFEHYVQYMNNLNYWAWGTHYLPHDAAHGRMLREVKTYEQILLDLGLRNTLVVPRTQDKVSARTETGNFLLNCFFDEENCAEGIKCLDNYRRKYDRRIQGWIEDEHDDEFTHGADAFICLACGREIDRAGDGIDQYLKERKRPPKKAFW